MDLIVIAACLVIVILFAVMLYYITETFSCKKSYVELEKKYEDDTKPIKIQISDLKTKVFELENDREKLQVLLTGQEERNKLLSKNILGKFTNGELVDNEGRCVYIADSTKGDLTFLQIKDTKKCNPIFSYEPNYKQISVKVGTSTKCIDAFNENEIVLNSEFYQWI